MPYMDRYGNMDPINIPPVMLAYIYIYIWVNEITSSRHERSLEIIVRIRGIIPFYGRKIQVSELL